MGIGYAWEKAMVAVDNMASSDRPLKVRIAQAYTDSLIRIRPSDDLPTDELRSLFHDIADALRTTEPYGDEGMAMASALAMNDDYASKIAHKITRLRDLVCCEAEAIPTR